MRELDNHSISVGDKVRCIPISIRTYAGAGYKENLIFEVTKIQSGYNGSPRVCFGGKDGSGVYEEYLELVEDENMSYTVPKLEEIKLVEETGMSLVSKVKQLAKNKDTRLLEEYGVINGGGALTGEGQELLIEHLFEVNRADIVEKIKALDAVESKKKK